jgi:hypothetical protein
MQPYIRQFLDPLDGLRAQLKELMGFARAVPPLIEADRQKRWDEIEARRDADGAVETVDVYAAEAGAEEGGGFADYARTVFSAALVLGWEVFRDFLVQELMEHVNAWVPQGHAVARQLVQGEERLIAERFDHLRKRYKDWLNLPLPSVIGWNNVEQLRLTRNAIVHNLGLYTKRYLAGPAPRRPTPNVFGLSDDASLVNHELIPLDEPYARGTLSALIAFAEAVRAHNNALPKGGPTAAGQP